MTYEEVKTPIELYRFMKENIKYGFFSSWDKKTHSRSEINNDLLYEKLLFNTYSLQTPEEVLKRGYGICYDQVELERFFFETHGYDVKTYYTPYHNHAFLIYRDKNQYCIFERSIKKLNGIYSKNSLEEVLNYYKKMQLKDTNIDNIKFYEYQNVEFGCGIYDFIDLVTKEEKYGSKLKQKMKNYLNK